MNQEPTQEQISQNAGASAPGATQVPEENARDTVQQEPSGFFAKLYSTLRMVLGTLLGGASAPGTENPEAQTDRSQWGWFKNAIMGLFGKDKPFYDAARSLRNTSWERKRGNDYNKTYDSDGRLSLTLRDGILSERALQMLAALDASDTKELDPSSAGIGKLPDISNMMQHKSDKEMCDKLTDLRKRLQANGGALEVIPSSDGFSRVLKITIDPRNKTVEQIQKEVEDIFSVLGIGGPQMAESIAKELVRNRDSQRSSQDAGMSSTHVGRGQSQACSRTVDQELGMSSTPDRPARSDTTSDPVTSSRRDSASMSSDPSIESASFSLSGGTMAVPSSPGSNHSVLQGRYLSSSAQSLEQGSSTAGLQDPAHLCTQTLQEAAAGLAVVSGVSSVDIASPVAAPSVSSPEASTSQTKGTIRGV
ncbi:type IV secretion system effector Ats1 [Anaplasma platys]|uniref:Type IV secretion system effector Ats1 n=1 Tax=Anaplasma platys TaxID=949 RepID=A0A858PYJ5_9RICK|nr:hypothetical protein [Anaplasma platys]QJC27686.1 type IV secretion system effector Ats1 [Anaplasma platys]